MYKSEYVQVESLRDERMYTSVHSAPRHRTPTPPRPLFSIRNHNYKLFKNNKTLFIRLCFIKLIISNKYLCERMKHPKLSLCE